MEFGKIINKSDVTPPVARYTDDISLCPENVLLSASFPAADFNRIKGLFVVSRTLLHAGGTTATDGLSILGQATDGTWGDFALTNDSGYMYVNGCFIASNFVNKNTSKLLIN